MSALLPSLRLRTVVGNEVIASEYECNKSSELMMITKTTVVYWSSDVGRGITTERVSIKISTHRIYKMNDKFMQYMRLK